MFFRRGPKIDINTAVENLKNDKNALLVDVREADEYKAGHIPGAINVPLSTIQNSHKKKLPKKDQPIHMYCVTGPRAQTAVNYLKSQGYTAAQNIGGIASYKGSLKR
ncbi:MAG: rhodanese-like domain-containing protein [Tissierellia bacterium]|nr:rhodanese-like domain-containing protein [Tissierellia bacterium]